ncbi:MAG: polyphosphate kinase 1 [Chitinophagaceae bacterium]
MQESIYYNRDLSWLSFNERVLEEADAPGVPLMERILFLSIYSSNLDEFYRVRIPALLALQHIETDKEDVLPLVRETIDAQLKVFGNIMRKLLPVLEMEGYVLLYDKPVPETIRQRAGHYFFTQVLGFLQPVVMQEGTDFFPENNKLYLLAGNTIFNVPSDQLPRFWTVKENGINYILFLDDLIRMHLPAITKDPAKTEAFSFKITRDAELNLKDDYQGDLVDRMEEEISKRDFGLATRVLYDPAMPEAQLETLIRFFQLNGASLVKGGRYHHLKDLASLPVNNPDLRYEPMPPVSDGLEDITCLLDEVGKRDILLHPPFHSYDNVLRFFNEAATDASVQEVYVTLYRMADQSKIAQALISAAKNGKKVFVMVELKARFDEANNIRWTRRMKKAGVKVVHSRTSLKVHAKIALVVRQTEQGEQLLGLLATGNLNETTARFYTDHLLLTARKDMLEELHRLFQFLVSGKKPSEAGDLQFQHLLVARFNLKEQFTALIRREITHAQQGLPASIHIKMNNLEEKSMITLLYEAAQAGVQITLLVRGICCLQPGVSTNITVRRIVDRYLEHGRIFCFHNNGTTEVYLGSADWMNRNLHRRIEVCFPIRDAAARAELQEMMLLQLQDNVKARPLPENTNGKPIRSQYAIWERLREKMALALLLLFFVSCNMVNRDFKSPGGYDFTAPEKFFISDDLTEISGIALNGDRTDSMYAVQDEKGKLFRFKPGMKKPHKVNFAKTGDYEDVSIADNQVWVLKSNGHLINFPLNADSAGFVEPVVHENILPKGEYEAMDIDGGNIYVLCKTCKVNKKQPAVTGYVLRADTAGKLMISSSFQLAESQIPEQFKKKNFSLHPSAMAKHPLNGNWYIMASANKLLVVADTNWQIKETYRLAPSVFRQPEGLVFASSGDMYVSNEGDDISVANLLLFRWKNKQQ